MRAILLTQLSVFAFAAAAQAGLIHTVAGGGSSYGDGGPATAAQLTTPQGLAFDAAGNLYIADDSAFVVRRVDAATGIITTVAGDGNYGDQGDGGPATSASLSTPFSVAVDLFGDLYIADQLNHRIRKVDLGTGAGTITTIAGSVFGNSGDQGPAVNALLGFPEGVAVDAIGDVYIADTQNAAVRKVIRETGIIIRIAGGTGGSSTGDGGPATAATFTYLRQIAVDLAGNVFIADANGAGSTVRRIDAVSGIIDRVAGGGSSTGESGLATDANLFDLRSVAVDDSGNLYVASGVRVWKVDASGNIAVHAGVGVSGFSGDGGPAALAMLGDVGGVAVASNGDVYIGDFGSARVRKVDADAPVPVPAMGLTARLLAVALLAALAIPVARGRRPCGSAARRAARAPTAAPGPRAARVP